MHTSLQILWLLLYTRLRYSRVWDASENGDILTERWAIAIPPRDSQE